MTILRRAVTACTINGITYARAHVWTARGYSSRTFLTAREAETWEPQE